MAKKSSEKLDWTPEQRAAFANSKKEIENLDKLFLPAPGDQLILKWDYSQQGISATLWGLNDNSNHQVVARLSAELKPTQKNLLPCEVEGLAAYIGLTYPEINKYIKASNKRTIAFTDNKPLYQAANLLAQGKFSSSKFLNNLLIAVSSLNVEFQHLCGKLGQNFADDYGSRNPTNCGNRQS